MRITFSFSFSDLTEKQAQIEQIIGGFLPDADLGVDRASAKISVASFAITDPYAVANDLLSQFRAIGVQASYTVEGARVDAGPFYEQKRVRTVRLSTFVVSLVATALAVAIGVFSVTAALMGFLGVGGATLGTESESGENYKQKIALVDKLFKEYSLYDINGDLMLDEMLKAYAAATGDDYAAYYTEEELAELRAQNGAEFVGVGVTVIENVEKKAIEVIEVIENSPAHQAGVLSGDLIVSLGSGDGLVSVAEKGYTPSLAMLRGEVDTLAEFTVLRGEEELSFSMRRAKIRSVSVKGYISESDASIGIVRISRFSLSAPAQFKEVMNALISQGCTRFVYDVRNNPGGDLKSVIAVLSLFLNKNDTILSTVEKDGTTTYYKAGAAKYKGDYAGCSVSAEELGIYRDLEKVVLTNGSTASAAELFTAVLSEYELATVMGVTTYGKGIIQSIYDLSRFGPYSGSIRLTVGYYSPPSGKNYHGVGISPAPECVVELDPALAGKHLYTLTQQEDNQLKAAVSYLQ